ncbi:hypothetical protein L198_01868 [Cryptococcus wingfieldii CBS 7118]|uniref:Uncharacterized protein n=1 Tax=Cryptococcus wingfieldii CBS 7118 TaxID=1295528 RepID=A0A1E3JWE5_9TREE|nr:hypothetical protein L198_01868 [Cryptococcus wingfieldii CBS 7118]ODO05179.1 hypothetical protein L198_01868 [Cryptococcus wingfieldii CBS 7118]
MSQSILLPAYSPNHAFSSPDPTPLRDLAFSVAEAALQPDPNSPSLHMSMPKMPSPSELVRSGGWPAPAASFDRDEWVHDDWTQKAVRKSAWEANGYERRVLIRSSDDNAMSSPPVSPSSYNFSLPPNSPLAKSVASQGYYSPTAATFSGLDQTRPPPEFKPRLSAIERDSKAKNDAPKHARTQSALPLSGNKENKASTSRMRLPSLAEIQAKMTFGSPSRQSPHRAPVVRMDSQESIEVIKTPTEECPAPRLEARLALSSILNRRPSTPPNTESGAPMSPTKESRLAPFLRERTSGRLSGRPVSMPPMTFSADQLASLAAIGNGRSSTPPQRPALTITPPKERSVPTGQVPTPRAAFLRTFSGQASPTSRTMISTPPLRSATTPSTRRSYFSPALASPTGSMSPTLSIPMITCTPAPATVLKDGKEVDSDEEEGDVVLFEGEIFESESESDEDEVLSEGGEIEQEMMKEREREMRAEVMKRMLMQRRKSD